MAPAAEVAPRILVNGETLGHVSALDRGLGYGDGVFRTLRIEAGQPRWWDEHLARLAEDCARLRLDCPSRDTLERDLSDLAPLPAWGVLRITLTRGEGPRGYRPPSPARGTRILACWPDPHALPRDNIRARVCDLRLAWQPALAGIKHLNRLEQVLARAEWDDADIDEGILLDRDGRIVCGVSSNLFFWRDDGLHTPVLRGCGVAGVTRGRLLRRAASAGIAVREGEYVLDDLWQAQEVMLTNSLTGLRRVARLEEKIWETPVFSPRLRELLDA